MKTLIEIINTDNEPNIIEEKFKKMVKEFILNQNQMTLVLKYLDGIVFHRLESDGFHHVVTYRRKFDKYVEEVLLQQKEEYTFTEFEHSDIG